jgi:DNA-binding transcriptional regulator GbsR (MarR family)
MESKVLKTMENQEHCHVGTTSTTPRSAGQRQLRLETRARANDIKRLVHTVEKVRKWERRLVEIDSTSLKLYKWVPTSSTN